jgi:two-component system response regulator AtoC
VQNKGRENLLLVEDDELFRQAMIDYLSDKYEIHAAGSGESALQFLKTNRINAVLLDISLPGEDGIAVLRDIRESFSDLPVIMLTAVDRIQTVVQCVKMGATDYLTKPVIVEELLSSVERAIESSQLQGELKRRRDLQIFENSEYKLIGQSPALEGVRQQIRTVGPTDAAVLIVGETGTGKEIAARMIHAASFRAGQPFVPINCGGIPKDLFETEFFGHKKGAFTGAHSTEPGKFQLANHGTLLLDEIGELALDTQTKLLRILEEGEFFPVGSTQLVQVNVRMIACTNRNLDVLVQKRQFREDLYFRINVYTIEIAPLRERKEDIVPIALYWMERFNRKFNKRFSAISEEAQQLLLKNPWKGNVRELKNVIERIILSESSNRIDPEHLLRVPTFQTHGFANDSAPFVLPENGMDLEEVEKQFILQALKKSNGNKTRAAKLLNMSPPTLYYRLEKYGIS